jgi:hypothetical protein
LEVPKGGDDEGLDFKERTEDEMKVCRFGRAYFP